MGVFNDPWRMGQEDPAPTVNTPPPTLPSAPPIPVEEPPSLLTPHEDNAQTEAVKKTYIQLENYGSIVVTGIDTPQDAIKLILEFCIKNLKDVEQTLLQFGIVVVKLKPNQAVNTEFYIRRSDGWILAVPEVTTRREGLLQLIQALLALNINPRTRELLKAYNIQPQKL